MYLTLFTKAHVPAHNRVLASGKVVRVSAYDDRRPHRRSAGPLARLGAASARSLDLADRRVPAPPVCGGPGAARRATAKTGGAGTGKTQTCLSFAGELPAGGGRPIDVRSK